MLIDEFMPLFDVNEMHRIEIGARPVSVYAALRSTDLAESGLTRALLLLRALPGALAHPGRAGEFGSKRSAPVTLRTFEDRGFRILGEDPPNELVLGLEGKFWLPTGAICTPSAEFFKAVSPAPGTARAVWNFAVTSRADGCVLSTETRVLCSDASTRRRFLPYWALIKLGSGLIRRSMLKSVKRAAKAAPLTVS